MPCHFEGFVFVANKNLIKLIAVGHTQKKINNNENRREEKIEKQSDTY